MDEEMNRKDQENQGNEAKNQEIKAI